MLNTPSIVHNIKHPVSAYMITKMKNAHRKANPTCACCGIGPKFLRRKNEVHHPLPVHVFPEQAAMLSNALTLCRTCHFRIGHFSNWKLYNIGVRKTCHEVGLLVGRAALQYLRR